MRNLQIVVVVATLAAALAETTPQAIASENHRSGNNECVIWHAYNENMLAAILQQKDTIIRTDCQVACRVLQQSDGEISNDYYEFGTIDLSDNAVGSSTPLCILHRDPSLKHTDFQVAAQNEVRCDHFWAPISFDVDPLGPNIVRVEIEAPELGPSSDVAICRFRSDENEFIGRMLMNGKLFGHCEYLPIGQNKPIFVGGNFHVLSAVPKAVPEIDDSYTHERNNLVSEIQKRVSLYLSEQDTSLISSISGHSVKELMDDLNNASITSYSVLARILSTDRFIPHDVLNTKGLSLLRAVLAERMTLARRRHLGLNHHADAAQWERDGMLLKDFDYFTKEGNLEEFEELLRMVSAAESVSAAEFKWVERNVTSVTDDPQLEPHIDTFYSVVKIWVYEKGVVTADKGPLHYMLGSNRNTRGKLQWIYNVSLPPATEAIREPSLRFHGVQLSSENVMGDILRPVLPLESYNRTMIIADTSGIHHRGSAIPGTVRKTIRVSNGNDGGLPRVDPYFWDGWENPEAVDEEVACYEPASLL